MTPSDDGERVVPFPVPEEERARRLKIEVERLARLSTTEWIYYVESAGYAEKYGVDKATFKMMVEVVVKEIAKKAREDRGELRRREDQAEKKRDTAKRDEERQADRKVRARERQERERERRERAARTEADRKARETQKALAVIVKLPSAQHEAELKSTTILRSCAPSSMSCLATRPRRSGVGSLNLGTNRSTRASC
jgi:hypothetical protein